MSTPHDYYDENNNPHLEARGETAIYEDPDYIANECGDQLSLVSSIGAGPTGEGIIIDPVNSNDEQGTFDFGMKSDKTGQEFRHTPNLHAGHLHANLRPEPADTEYEGHPEHTDRQIPENESEVTHILDIYNKRNNVDKLLASVPLPQGAHGSRIYISKREHPYELNDKYTIHLDTSDLIYSGTSLGPDKQHKAYDDQPYPHNWDVVIAFVEHPTEHYNCISAGLVLQANSDQAIIQFRSLFRCTEQVRADFHETIQSKMSYIEGREDIEDRRQKSDIVVFDPGGHTGKYPSLKAVHDMKIEIEGSIAEEARKRALQDGILQDHIDAEETRAIEAEQLERTKRIALGTTLSNMINAEATARQQADAQEAATREAKDEETLEAAEEYTDDKIEDHDKNTYSGTENKNHKFIRDLITALTTAFNNFKTWVEDRTMSDTSANNKNANVAFVNSSIASETANYIKNPDTGDVWDSLADLKAYTTTSTVGNNDYAVIQTEVESENADPAYKYDRYKFTKGSTPYADGWGREYTLHPGFTAAQWAALMSGANTTNIAQITTNKNDITQLESDVDNLDSTKVDKTTTVNGHALSSDVTVSKSDVGLGNADNTSDLNKPISTATQNALDDKQDELTAGDEIDITDNTISFEPTGTHATVLDSGITSTKVGNYDTHVAKNHVYAKDADINNAMNEVWTIQYPDGTTIEKDMLMVYHAPTVTKKRKKSILQKLNEVTDKGKKKTKRAKKAGK